MAIGLTCLSDVVLGPHRGAGKAADLQLQTLGAALHLANHAGLGARAH